MDDLTEVTDSPSDLGPDPEESLPRMTLSEHLDELRRRVVRSAIALVAGMVLAFCFYKDLVHLVTEPFREAVRDAGGVPSQLQSLSPLDGFVSAGLYPHEKKAVRMFFPVSVVLFALGCATAFVMILPIGLRFLMSFSHGNEWTTNYAIGEYLSLLLSLVFGTGIAFQMPLLILFLEATGIVEREAFAKNWRIAVLGAFVVTMVVTPDPTPVSQVIMAIPLVGLYFLGVWGGRFVGEDREQFTWWKAWPLLLTFLAIFAILFFGRDLAHAAGRLFN